MNIINIEFEYINIKLKNIIKIIFNTALFIIIIGFDKIKIKKKKTDTNKHNKKLLCDISSKK